MSPNPQQGVQHLVTDYSPIERIVADEDDAIAGERIVSLDKVVGIVRIPDPVVGGIPLDVGQRLLDARAGFHHRPPACIDGWRKKQLGVRRQRWIDQVTARHARNERKDCGTHAIATRRREDLDRRGHHQR
jgi:hypothetical protein